MTASLPLTEFSSGAILVFLLQQLKRIPWFNALAGWFYTAASAVWALVSTIIVSWEWNPHPLGGGSLTIVLPSLGVALIAIWHFIEQFCINETIYQTTANRAPAQPSGKASQLSSPHNVTTSAPGGY